MHTPAVTVEELLAENRRLREAHAKELARRTESLRDEFARHAPDPGTITGGTRKRNETLEEWAARRAEVAYAYADAMLYRREVKK